MYAKNKPIDYAIAADAGIQLGKAGFADLDILQNIGKFRQAVEAVFDPFLEKAEGRDRERMIRVARALSKNTVIDHVQDIMPPDEDAEYFVIPDTTRRGDHVEIRLGLWMYGGRANYDNQLDRQNAETFAGTLEERLPMDLDSIGGLDISLEEGPNFRVLQNPAKSPDGRKLLPSTYFVEATLLSSVPYDRLLEIQSKHGAKFRIR